MDYYSGKCNFIDYTEVITIPRQKEVAHKTKALFTCHLAHEKEIWHYLIRSVRGFTAFMALWWGPVCFKQPREECSPEDGACRVPWHRDVFITRINPRLFFFCYFFLGEENIPIKNIEMTVTEKSSGVLKCLPLIIGVRPGGPHVTPDRGFSPNWYTVPRINRWLLQQPCISTLGWQWSLKCSSGEGADRPQTREGEEWLLPLPGFRISSLLQNRKS